MIRWVDGSCRPRSPLLVDCSKVRALGWEPRVDYKEGLAQTIDWYRDNRAWWEKIKSGEWKRYYERQYQGLAK